MPSWVATRKRRTGEKEPAYKWVWSPQSSCFERFIWSQNFTSGPFHVLSRPDPRIWRPRSLVSNDDRLSPTEDLGLEADAWISPGSHFGPRESPFEAWSSYLEVAITRFWRDILLTSSFFKRPSPSRLQRALGDWQEAKGPSHQCRRKVPVSSYIMLIWFSIVVFNADIQCEILAHHRQSAQMLHLRTRT